MPTVSKSFYLFYLFIQFIFMLLYLLNCYFIVILGNFYYPGNCLDPILEKVKVSGILGETVHIILNIIWGKRTEETCILDFRRADLEG